MDVCADSTCSAKTSFAVSQRFVYEFGRLPFDAKLLDGCVQLEHALLEINQQKAENATDFDVSVGDPIATASSETNAWLRSVNSSSLTAAAAEGLRVRKV